MAPTPAPDLIHLLAEDAWARRLARALVHDAAEADDLVQEAYARTLAGQAERGDRVQSPRAWLARVIGNLHNEWRRSLAARAQRERWSSAGAAEQAASPDELVARAEVQQLLATAVLELEPRQRELVLLHHFEGVTVAALAARAEVSRATMHERLERAHGELRRRLGHLQRDTRLSRGLGLLLAPRALDAHTLSAGAAAVAPLPTTTLALAMSSAKLTLVACVALAVSLLAWRSIFDPSTSDTPAPVGAANSPPETAPAHTTEGATAAVVDPAPAPAASRSAVAPPSDPVAPAATSDTASVAAGARIAGMVVDAEGEPVPGARVWTGATAALRTLESGAALPAGLVAVESDATGRFELAGLTAGAARLTAAGEGFACSETLVVQLAEGARHDDVQLVLRRGATIHGVVFGPRGTPAAGRAVTAFVQELGQRRTATCDQTGAFELPGLEPARWTLQSLPTPAELEADGLPADPLLHAVQANVRVVDGERREVLMGAPPARPVVVTGTVRRADGQGASGMMQWMPEGEDPAAHQKVVQTDAEGRYMVTLPSAGSWLVGAHAGRGRLETLVTVPEVERFEHDLVVPGGALTGRVVDEAGQPVAGIEVTLHVERNTRVLSPFSSTSTQKRTDEEGRFAFTALTPALYTVVVHGRAGTADMDALSLTTMRGVVVATVADAAQPELKIELARGVALSGAVVDEHGFGVDQGVVFVRDAAGEVLNPSSTTRIGADGRFTTAPLVPGAYSIAAWVAGRASAPVQVRVGDAASGPQDEARELALVARPAAIVLVGLGGLDANTAVLSVRDGAGCEHANLLDPRRPWDFIVDGFGAEVLRAGPLPPGRYEVSGRDGAGRVGSAEVEVGDVERVRVELVLRR